MKNYDVLYARDIPHYSTTEIKARSPEDALAKARELDTEDNANFSDAAWDHPVCRRIIHIEDQDGTIIAQDVPLDDFALMRGDRNHFDAASDMLAALQECTAAMREMRHQIDQMTGLLPDCDDAITNACTDHEAADKAARAAIAKARGLK